MTTCKYAERQIATHKILHSHYIYLMFQMLHSLFFFFIFVDVWHSFTSTVLTPVTKEKKYVVRWVTKIKDTVDSKIHWKPKYLQTWFETWLFNYQCSHQIETSHFTCSPNQLTGFYIMWRLAVYELMLP